jgi:hypothetical protein
VFETQTVVLTATLRTLRNVVGHLGLTSGSALDVSVAECHDGSLHTLAKTFAPLLFELDIKSVIYVTSHFRTNDI